MPKRKADAAAAAPAVKKPKGAAAPAKTTTAKKGAAAGAAAKKPAKGGMRPQIVLAHAAGHHPKGGKHPAMQRWAAALKSVGDVHDALVYPKPFNLMPRLVEAHAQAAAAAAGTGPKKAPVVLVGVGMGARVAVHLLSGAAGDDGKPLGPVPAELKAAVKACVCIDYPLLRVGTREVRAAPLLAVPAAGPKMLFVRGPADKHMDASRLPLAKLKPKATEVLVAGKSEAPSAADMAAVVARIAALV